MESARRGLSEVDRATSSRWDRLGPAAGLAFVVLAVAGNALQGSTPPPHAAATEAVAFYGENPTMVALGMSLSLIALFFLALFLETLHHALLRTPGHDRRYASMATGGGVAAITLLAAGFALNSLGALRARAQGGLPPETAAVFYDGSLALTALAAPVALSILLAPTAVLALRGAVLPRWFGWLTAVLAALGLITPLSFVLFLVFPLWVLVASFLLHRGGPLRAPATSPT